MNHHRRLAALPVFLLTACAPPPAANTGAQSGMGSENIQASMMVSLPKPKDGKPGKPEDHALEMLQYAASLPFGQGVPASDIVDDSLACESSCDATHTKARIQIVPSNYAPEVGWGKILNPGPGTPPNGHIVAKISNLNDYPFPPLQMGPQEVAYLWIGEIRGSANAKAAIYKLDGSTAFKLKEARTLICPKAVGPPAVHLFPSPGCDQRVSMQMASTEPIAKLASLFTRETRTTMLHGSGLWVSCSEGCCQVTMVQ